MEEKQAIIVVDLDKTLISVDSLRYLILQNIFYPKVLFYTVLRKLRLINRFFFVKSVFHFIYKKKDTTYFNTFINEIMQKINKPVFDKVINMADNKTNVILLSASPHYYVSKIAERVDWKGYGSTFESSNNTLDNYLYGENKLQFLLKAFPSEKYFYKYAISDSKSDIALLHQFESYDLI